MVNLNRFRRNGDQQARFYDKPARECHFLSIIGSVLSIVLLILAMALREWAKGSDSQCDIVFGLTQVQVQGINNPDGQNGLKPMTKYYSTSQQILISCILSVTALTMLSSIVATIISAGYPREKLEFLRHYAVFNIVSLLCTVLAAGLWLAVAESLPTKNFNCFVENTKVEIHFGYAYYILLVGGLFSLGGAAFNLLFAKSAAERRRSLRLRFRQRQQLSNRAPPAYSLLGTSDFSETETETETSMSEPEESEPEPLTPPPAYTP